jgi:hypothetical protein
MTLSDKTKDLAEHAKAAAAGHKQQIKTATLKAQEKAQEQIAEARERAASHKPKDKS